MLTREKIDRIRSFDGKGLPVVSLYLDLAPDRETDRGLAARVKDLLGPISELAESKELPHDVRMSVRGDVERIQGLVPELLEAKGKGVGIFSCRGREFFEFVVTPRKLRDRAIADATPWIRPLFSVLDEYHRYFAAVVESRRAWIYEMFMGEIVCHEEAISEGVRKKNYAGWYGLEEHNVRHHAEELAHRHYKKTASLLLDLFQRHRAELLFLGGQEQNVTGFRGFLHSYLKDRVAGTFTIDTHTMTIEDVRRACLELEEVYERKEEQELVQQLMDTVGAGGPAVLGPERTLEAGNFGAIDLLLVEEGYERPGVVCTRCGWLALEGETCAACEGVVRRTEDVIDELVEAAYDTGARIEHVRAGTPLAEHGIGASLRFALPETA